MKYGNGKSRPGSPEGLPSSTLSYAKALAHTGSLVALLRRSPLKGCLVALDLTSKRSQPFEDFWV